MPSIHPTKSSTHFAPVRLPHLAWDRTLVSPSAFLTMCETVWLDQPNVVESIRVHHACRTIMTSGDDWPERFLTEQPNASWRDFRRVILDYYCNAGQLPYEHDVLNQQQLRTAGGTAYEEQFEAYVRRLNCSSQSTAARRLFLSHWLEAHYNRRSAMRLYLLDDLPFHQYVGKARTAMPPAPPPRRNAARFGQRNGNNSNNSRPGPRNNDNTGRTSSHTGQAGNGYNGPRRNNQPWRRNAQANTYEAEEPTADPAERT